MDETPAVNASVTAPVMRCIGVADMARSARFYREVLGFEIRDGSGTVEAVSGPARIQFGAKDYSPNDWDNPRPPGSAILFFQTGDVAGMRAAIAARGGSPS